MPDLPDAVPANQLSMPSPKTPRTIRSYVTREGRLTSGQARALTELWPRYGIDRTPGQLLDFAALFGRDAPVVCEVGFGDGGTLREMAAKRPEWNFLGIEVHRPGVGNLLLRLERDGITNVRIVREDAVTVLAQAVPTDSLHRFHLFFPDPWPKKRHHKRRILSPGFAELVASRLLPGEGIFHFATDWEDYAAQALAILEDCEALRNVHESGGYAERPQWRPETRFERRGRRLGHNVRDILMCRG